LVKPPCWASNSIVMNFPMLGIGELHLH